MPLGYSVYRLPAVGEEEEVFDRFELYGTGHYWPARSHQRFPISLQRHLRLFVVFLSGDE